MRRDGQPSPNQAAQRRRLIDGAKSVLLRDGPSACTSRTIAQETGLTNGLIHYYFGTVQEIVSAAMAELYEGIRVRISATGGRGGEPAQQLWAVVEAYLDVFDIRNALLWFDYWVDQLRKGRPDQIVDVHDRSVEVLAVILADAGVPQPGARARALYSYIVGLVMIKQTNPRDWVQIREDLRIMCGVSVEGDRPAPQRA